MLDSLRLFYIHDDKLGFGAGFKLDGPVGNAGGYDKVGVVTLFQAINTVVLPDTKPID